jgi:uncharacterized peroxidase-related enzyme
MSFIDTIAPGEASAEVRAMYQRQQDHWGYIPEYAKVFSHRPEVLARWARLLAEIRRPLDDRRFELATFAAAHELGNTACALTHGNALAHFIGADAVCQLAAGELPAALSAAEHVIATFARKVVRDAVSVTAQDVAELKRHGLSDAEVFDIVAVAAGRAFFTRMLDGLGVLADRVVNEIDPMLLENLVVGRPVSTDPVSLLEEAAAADDPRSPSVS